MAEVKKSMFQEIGTDVETRLAFNPEEENNFLCRAQLIDVELKDREIAAITSTGETAKSEYAGNTVKDLVLTFKQATSKKNPKPRYYTHRESIIVAVNSNNEENIYFDNLLKNMYIRLVHICKAFSGSKGFSLDISKLGDIDKTASVKKRISQFNAFFEFFANVLKGTEEKPVYEGVPLWVKLVASSNGKYLTFPDFVNKGFIERRVEGQNPTLEFAYNESHVLTGKSSRKGNSDAPVADQQLNDSEMDDILKDFQ